jgi:hypothetical protein
MAEEGPAFELEGEGSLLVGGTPGTSLAPTTTNKPTTVQRNGRTSRDVAPRPAAPSAVNLWKRFAWAMCGLFVVSAMRALSDYRALVDGQRVTERRSAMRREKASGSHDGPALLPWLPWEREAMTNGRCRAPSKIPRRCCVGTSSSGGEISVSAQCLGKGTVRALVWVRARWWCCYADMGNGVDSSGALVLPPHAACIFSDVSASSADAPQGPYDRVKERAADFLRKHPVPPSRLSTRPSDCDTCRIVDLLMANNFTLTLQGDSVMGQVFQGLECDLLRRGYTVSIHAEDHPHIEGLGWRYGLRHTYTLRISFPNRTGTSSGGGTEAVVLFRAMYRPIRDMHQVATIADETDVLVFDHGLHYGPQDSDSMEELRASTAGILAAVRNSTRTKLVAWRETTPQHYNTSGGQ